MWDFKPTLSPLTGAAFMNAVRWIMLKEVQEIAKEHNANVHMTYGAVTKRERKDRNLAKSHANDAYCIGNHRSLSRHMVRRTNVSKSSKAALQMKALKYRTTSTGTAISFLSWEQTSADSSAMYFTRSGDLFFTNLRFWRS